MIPAIAPPFPVPLAFPDVDAAILAQEDAAPGREASVSEARHGETGPAGSWGAYLRRLLPYASLGDGRAVGASA